MERLIPIGEVERDLRRQGIFILVDFSGRKLWFYGYLKSQISLNKTMESLTNRRHEMIQLLTARARAKGETT
jgi:hypothetical protein